MDGRKIDSKDCSWYSALQGRAGQKGTRRHPAAACLRLHALPRNNRVWALHVLARPHHAPPLLQHMQRSRPHIQAGKLRRWSYPSFACQFVHADAAQHAEKRRCPKARCQPHMGSQTASPTDQQQLMSSGYPRLTCSFCRFASSFSRCSGGSLRRRSCRTAGAQQRPSGARRRMGWPGTQGMGTLAAAAARHVDGCAQQLDSNSKPMPMPMPMPCLLLLQLGQAPLLRPLAHLILQRSGGGDRRRRKTGSESVGTQARSLCACQLPSRHSAAPSSHQQPPKQGELACLLAGASSCLALGPRIRGPLLLLCTLRLKNVDRSGPRHSSTTTHTAAAACSRFQHNAWRVQRQTGTHRTAPLPPNVPPLLHNASAHRGSAGSCPSGRSAGRPG